MELLQKIDIKMADNSQKRIDTQARKTPSNTADKAQEKAFKDQLDDQKEQLNSRADLKKVETNQEDNSTQSIKENNTDEKTEVTTEPVQTQAGDESDKEIYASLAQSEVGKDGARKNDLVSPVIAAPLTETGNNLPPDNTLKDSLESQQVKQEVLMPLNVNASNSLLQRSADGVDEVGVDSLAVDPQKNDSLGWQLKQSFKLSQTNALSHGGQTTTAESSTQKPFNSAVNLTSNFSEKPLFQNTKLVNIMSGEMQTAEVISQASRLQQVPITTAVSASLSAAQNISVSVPAETTGALSYVQPLSNAPLSTLSSSIGINIENKNWSQQMSQQVSYMAKSGFQQAEIKLNPAHLGPMEIKLSIKDDQATVSFVTQHAPVRDAVDAALPRLKEMLEQQGLNLAGADVSTQSEQQQGSSEAQQGDEDNFTDAANDLEHEANIVESKNTHVIVESGVSVFA